MWPQAPRPRSFLPRSGLAGLLLVAACAEGGSDRDSTGAPSNTGTFADAGGIPQDAGGRGDASTNSGGSIISGSTQDSGGSTIRDGGSSGSGALDGGATSDAAIPSGGAGCALKPNTDGWIDVASNGAHVQGAVFTYQSTGSMITPLTSATTPFTNAGDGKLCVKGSAAKVIGMDFSTYYGAGLAFDLCQADAKSSTKYTLGECPLGKGLGGIRFTLSGITIPNELRVSFHEAGRDESTYVLAKAGANEALFKDGTVAYNTAAPPVNVDKIDSVHFMIATNELDAVPFDFCVEKVEFVMISGSCAGGASGDAGSASTDGDHDAGSSGDSGGTDSGSSDSGSTD